MKNTLKKMLSIVLTVMMLAAMLPTGLAMAEGEGVTPPAPAPAAPTEGGEGGEGGSTVPALGDGNGGYCISEAHPECQHTEHEHGPLCYERDKTVDPVCGKTEHTHSEELGCFETVVIPAVVDEESGEIITSAETKQILICNEEQHTHGDECYPFKLICKKDVHKHAVAPFFCWNCHKEAEELWEHALDCPKFEAAFVVAPSSFTLLTGNSQELTVDLSAMGDGAAVTKVGSNDLDVATVTKIEQQPNKYIVTAGTTTGSAIITFEAKVSLEGQELTREVKVYVTVKQKITLTFDAIGDGPGAAEGAGSTSVDYAKGDPVSAPTPSAAESFKFSGWEPAVQETAEENQTYKARYYEVPTEVPVTPDDEKYLTYTFVQENDDTLSPAQRVKKGDQLLEPATPTAPAGKKFAGWYTADDSLFTGWGTVGEITADATIELTAKFDAAYYVYFYDRSGARVIETRVPDGNNQVSTTGVLALEVGAGEALVGWTTEKGGESVNVPDTLTSATDMNLYPVVKDVAWIIYDTEGGSPINPAYKFQGATLSLTAADHPETERMGYTLGGWTASAGFADGHVFVGGETVTLTAVWSPGPSSYKIVYLTENADDTDYSYHSHEEKSAGVLSGDTIPSFTPKSIDGFTLDAEDFAANYESNKIVKGDKSTVITVKYKRNVYTVCFHDGQDGTPPQTGRGDLICQKEQHTHTNQNDSCYTRQLDCNKNHTHYYSCYKRVLTCTKEEHRHTDACYETVTTPGTPATHTTITAKWGAYIGDQWPVENGGRKAFLVDPNGSTMQSGLEIMPLGGDDFWPVTLSGSTIYKLLYYTECLPGTTGTATYNGRSYYLHHTDTVKTSSLSSTPDDHYAIRGFTYTNNITYSQGRASFDRNHEIRFYYNRNSYELNLYNYNYYFSQERVPYETDISAKGVTPERPSGIPAAYTFMGWYTSEACVPGSQFDFEGAKMPDNALTLYAKWAEPTFTGTVHVSSEAGNDTIPLSDIPYGATIPAEELENAKQEAIAKNQGKEFGGWKIRYTETKTDGTTTDHDEVYNAAMRIYWDVVLYPVWINSESFTVSYKEGTGVKIDPTLYGKDAQASVLSFEATGLTAPEGKLFLGWQIGGTGTLYYPGGLITITGNMTLVAAWGDPLAEYTLSFDKNCDDADVVTPDSIGNLLANATVELPKALTREDTTGEHRWIQLSWNTQANGTGTSFRPGQTATLSQMFPAGTPGNVTLYAIWADLLGAYEVSYYKGSTSTAPIHTTGIAYDEIGTPIPYGRDDLTAANIDLTGCDTTVNNWTLQGQTVVEGGTDADGKAIVSELKVVIPLIEYEVRYEIIAPAGITITPPRAQTGKHYGDSVTVEPKFDMVGYTFTDWATDDASVTNGTFSMPAKDVVFTCKAEPESFTFNVKVVGGTFSADVDGKTETDSTFTVPYGTREVKIAFTPDNGYGRDAVKLTDMNLIFLDPIAYAWWNNNTNTLTSIVPCCDRDIEVVFDPALYTLTYDANGGTGTVEDPTEYRTDDVNARVLPDTGLTPPANHSFAGWNTQANGKGTTYQPDEYILMNGNKTLYAQWVESIYTVSYAYTGTAPANAPTLPAAVDYNINEEVTVAAEPTAADEKDAFGNVIATWSFDGWYKGTEKVTSFNMPAEDVELVGTWTRTPVALDQYTVTYSWTWDGPEAHVPTGTNAPTLPTETASFVKNQPYTIEAEPDDIVITDTDGNTIGTWAFSGWTATAGLTNGKITGNVTISGIWTFTFKQYTIKYNVNNDAFGTLSRGTVTGKDEIVDEKQNYGTTLNVPTPVPASTAYYFTGWTPDPTGGTVKGDAVYTANFEEKGQIKLTAKSLKDDYDGTAKTVSGFEVSGMTAAEFAALDTEKVFTTTAVTQTNAGSYDHKFVETTTTELKAIDGKVWAITTEDGTLEITPATLTVTADDLTKSYGAENPELTYKITGFINDEENAETPVYSGVPALTTTATKTSGVGDYPIAVAEGTLTAANYTFAFVNGTLTIKPIATEITITADSNSKVYDGAPLTDNGFTYTPGILVSGDVLTAEVEGTITNVGTAKNKVTSHKVMRGTEDVTDNYTFGTSVDGTLEITPRPVTLTSATDSKVYNGTPLTNGTVTATLTNGTGTDAGFVTGQGATYTVTGSQLDVGNSKNTFTYELNTGTDTGNYDITKVEGTLTVTPITAEIVITADSDSKVYDGKALTDDGYTFTDNVLVSGDTLTAVVEGTITNVGTVANKVTSHKVMRGTEDVTGNYIFAAYADGELKITPRPVTLTSASATRVYNGEALTNDTVTVGGDGFLTGEGATYDVTGTITNVLYDADGNVIGVPNAFAYALKANTNAANYTIKKVEGTLTITPVAITITADNKTKVFGENDPALTATVTTDLVDGFAPVYTLDRVAGEDVGTYAITPAGGATQGNYTVTYVDGELTITAKEITIRADNMTKLYGTVDPAPTATVTGLVGGDTLPAGFYTLAHDPEPELTKNVAHGPYDITVALDPTTALTNYTVATMDGVLTVNPREITITAANQARLMGAANPVLTYTVADNFAPGENLAGILDTTAGTGVIGIATTALPGSPVGVYPITLDLSELVALKDNYRFVPVDGTLTVNPLPAFTLTFIVTGGIYGGGTVVFTDDYFAGAPIAAPNVAVPDGFTLSPWNAAVPAVMPAFDLTLTAELTAIPPEPEPDPDPDPIPDPEPPERFDEDDVPLAAPDYKAWALVNLILAVLTALGSALLLVTYIGKKKRAADLEKGIPETEIKKKLGWRLGSLVPGIGAIIAFILTEDMKNPMVLIDSWTLLMVAIALIQVGVAILAGRSEKEPEPEKLN